MTAMIKEISEVAERMNDYSVLSDGDRDNFNADMSSDIYGIYNIKDLSRKLIEYGKRPVTADAANSKYSRSENYAYGEANKPDKRNPKAYAEAGVSEDNAKWGILETDERGPNAEAHAGDSVTEVMETDDAPADADSEVTERNHCHNGVLFERRRSHFYAGMSSDIPRMKPVDIKHIKDWARKGLKPNVTKNPKLQPFNCGFSGLGGVIDIIDTFDRPGTANANSKYARKGTYSTGFVNKPGKRIPKAGAYAEAGIGEANAQWRIFEAEARGPNARAHAGATVTGVSAMATAGIGTASANAGPVGIKVGLQLDTGVSISLDGIEIKFLGIGFSIGPKTALSFLGNEVHVSVGK